MKYSIKDLHIAAQAKGGKCLSTSYAGALSHHEWNCGDCQHIWKATWSAINNNKSWCPKCSFIKSGLKVRKYTIKDLKEFALNKSGQLLSPQYSVAKKKYLWKCNLGHQWPASWEKILAGRWCPHCAKLKSIGQYKYTIGDMRKIARKLGGDCLSTVYSGIFEPLEFRCSNGHTFNRQPALLTKTNPLKRTWCSRCSNLNFGEEVCRIVFEKAFGLPFKNIRPGDWFKNARGNLMTLDGFNAEINVAFEFQGRQHYETVDFFRLDSKRLKILQADDLLKQKLCKENNIELIIIDEFDELKNLNEYYIFNHIYAACEKRGLKLPAVRLSDLKEQFSSTYSEDLSRLKKIARERGGELISTVYYGMATPLEWECGECNYKWKSSPLSIINQGSWCPKCVGNAPITAVDIEKLAKQRGGECLSLNDFEPGGNVSKQQFEWQCSECSHRWSALYSNVYKGHWCPNCPRERIRKKAEEKLIVFLNKRGEKLINRYSGSKKNVAVRCKNNHEWKGTPLGIQTGISNCDQCKIDGRHEKLKQIIISKGARFKGSYKTAKSPIIVFCHKKHEWPTTSGAVLYGAWCNECKKEEKRLVAKKKFVDLVNLKGGKLIGEYTTARIHVTLECGPKKHKWRVTPGSIKSGSWCPDCNGGVKKEK